MTSIFISGRFLFALTFLATIVLSGCDKNNLDEDSDNNKTLGLLPSEMAYRTSINKFFYNNTNQLIKLEHYFNDELEWIMEIAYDEKYRIKETKSIEYRPEDGVINKYEYKRIYNNEFPENKTLVLNGMGNYVYEIEFKNGLMQKLSNINGGAKAYKYEFIYDQENDLIGYENFYPHYGKTYIQSLQIDKNHFSPYKNVKHMDILDLTCDYMFYYPFILFGNNHFVTGGSGEHTFTSSALFNNKQYPEKIVISGIHINTVITYKYIEMK